MNRSMLVTVTFAVMWIVLAAWTILSGDHLSDAALQRLIRDVGSFTFE